MPIWTVEVADGEEERLEAAHLATESGVLVALSDEGLMVRAWSPGRWRTVRQISGVEAHPSGRSRDSECVLIGLPHQ